MDRDQPESGNRIIPILLYHSVSERCDPRYAPWNVNPAVFDRQMRRIVSSGFTTLTVSELTELRQTGRQIPNRSVLVTFDDGLDDFRTGALPVLLRHGVSATLYVVAGFVSGRSEWLAPLGEGDRPMLDWQSLRGMAGAAVEIGAHTVSHPQLDLIPAWRAEAEVRDSKRILEDRLERAVVSLAYPHGYYTPRLRSIVCDAGFTSACRVAHALSTDREGSYDLSRVIIDEETGDADFERILHGEGRAVAPPPHRLLSRCWRLVRKSRQLVGVPV